jgi:diacylglycerol kinase family enzyme
LEWLPTESRAVLIAANPNAGAKRAQSVIDQLVTELRRHSLEPRIAKSLDFLAEESSDLLAKGELRAVVAAGGDGTVAEVINRCTVGTPVAVLPMGTENLLAKYLEIGPSPVVLGQIIAQGRAAWLDAGRANGRLFLLMASVGFDAEVVRRLHATRDGNISRWSYAKPILNTIRTYRYPELRVHCAPDGGAEGRVVRGRWAFVFNVPRYGFGLRFVPQAQCADGELDLCAFTRGGFWRSLRYLAAVIRGSHQRLPDCVEIQASRFRIESDVEVPYELDGDPGGVLPLEIEIVPRRVRLLVSQTWSLAAD